MKIKGLQLTDILIIVLMSAVIGLDMDFAKLDTIDYVCLGAFAFGFWLWWPDFILPIGRIRNEKYLQIICGLILCCTMLLTGCGQGGGSPQIRPPTARLRPRAS